MQVLWLAPVEREHPIIPVQFSQGELVVPDAQPGELGREPHPFTGVMQGVDAFAQLAFHGRQQGPQLGHFVWLSRQMLEETDLSDRRRHGGLGCQVGEWARDAHRQRR